MVAVPGVPLAIDMPRASAAALRTVPARALIVAVRAVVSRVMNFGMAKAARMPKMVMTTTSSINVKPRVREEFIGDSVWRKRRSLSDDEYASWLEYRRSCGTLEVIWHSFIVLCT